MTYNKKYQLIMMKTKFNKKILTIDRNKLKIIKIKLEIWNSLQKIHHI